MSSWQEPGFSVTRHQTDILVQSVLKPNLFPGSGSFWHLTLCTFPSGNLVLPVENNANATSIRHPGPEAIISRLRTGPASSVCCQLPNHHRPCRGDLPSTGRLWDGKWEEPVAIQSSQTPGDWQPAAFWARLGPSPSQLDIFSIASVINFHKYSKLQTR